MISSISFVIASKMAREARDNVRTMQKGLARVNVAVNVKASVRSLVTAKASPVLVRISRALMPKILRL